MESLALLALVGAGLCLMLGLHRASGRLAFVAVGLIVLPPLLVAAARAVLGLLGEVLPVLVVLLVVVFVVRVWWRVRLVRRSLGRAFEPRSESLKRRLDRT